MIFDFIILATLIIGVWLAVWLIREMEQDYRAWLKLSVVVITVTASLIILFSSGREKDIASVALQVEKDGGIITVKSRKWINKLPQRFIFKDIADHVAGKEEISVDLRFTNVRDISYLRDLPTLTKLDLRGADYVTDYQISRITRKFSDCKVQK